MRFVFAPIGYSLVDNESLPENCYDSDVVCETIEEVYKKASEIGIYEWALLDSIDLGYYGKVEVH